MASYTTELRTIIEAHSQFEPNLTTRERIEIGRKKLFDFSYEMFDDSYKAVFETNFIRNFYMREIGFETEELFKFYLETWIRINMPYFNKMFESELIEYNPLFNVDMTEDANTKSDKIQKDNRDVTQTAKTSGTSDGTNDQTSKQDATTSGKQNGTESEDNFNRGLVSDTPDSRLSITPNADGTGSIEYASKITENKDKNGSTSKSDSSGESHVDSTDKVVSHNEAKTNSDATSKDVLASDINEIEDYINHKVGKVGAVSYPQLVKEYRDSLLRIEKTIFSDKETQQLFMLVY
jgi:hypothetical protein